MMFLNHLYMIKLFSSLLCILSIHTITSATNETDWLALLDFKDKITDDPLSVMSSWNNSVPFCQWPGVTCSRRHQRVIALDLASSDLVGSISPHIWNLSFLQQLRLQSNSFSNELPPGVGRLRRLRFLDLSNNSLAGGILTNLTSCVNLISIRLATNRLVGKLPMELGSLPKLQVLSLHQNRFNGDIPSSLGNITSLRLLSMHSNQFGGKIPDSLGRLRNLTFLGFGANMLVGTVPPSIFNLSSLVSFDVQQNNLHGSLPSDLGFTLPNIKFFNILVNYFSGSIPPSLSNASNLVEIFLHTNNLTGNVPYLHNLPNLERLSLTLNHLGNGEAGDLSFISSLTNATNFLKLSLNANNFGGVIPESIGNLSTTMTFLLLDNNQISGTVPAGIGNLVNLTRLELWNNHLSGTIPESLGKLRQLQVLLLSDNNFTGNIPAFLGDLVYLNSLDLGRNKLHGSIPSALGRCQNLLDLDLSVNNISGVIPSRLFTISSLSVKLNLSHNHLTGALPVEVGNLKNLGKLDVSGNLLTGDVPSSLGSCVRLEVLSMEGNFFNGTIPSSLSSLRGLLGLDLSHNNFSGEIPKFLEGFLLQNLDLSYNSFVGMVPSEGVFKNASATSVVGNGMLCGGISEFHLPKCSINEPKTLKVKYLIIYAVLALFIGALVVFAVGVWFCCFRKNKKRTASSNNLVYQMSYRTLFEATDGFSSTNLIGSGGYGSVFKGIIDQENIVAVKVFNLQTRGASKSFIAECAAFRNIRHRNLLKVVTVCSSIDSHGNDFKAIVYEFMVNGSLKEWLHPTPSIQDPSEPTRRLNLLQRLNIAIDVAWSIDYLHHQCHTTIVHCDLKPSNVLLDEDMIAHVGDFGLMKFFSDANDDSPSNHTNSNAVRGTVGYTAPEYGMGSEVSIYGDMYSYGILVLEMFAAKTPTNNMFNDNMNLHYYVKMALPEQVEEVTDTILVEGREDDETNQKLREFLVLIFGIGIACSHEMPRERMDIGDAAAKLVVIRDNLIATV